MVSGGGVSDTAGCPVISEFQINHEHFFRIISFAHTLHGRYLCLKIQIYVKFRFQLGVLCVFVNLATLLQGLVLS